MATDSGLAFALGRDDAADLFVVLEAFLHSARSPGDWYVGPCVVAQEALQERLRAGDVTDARARLGQIA